MSKIQTLRAFVKQRLTAATEEIFEVFERTIAEYEEELCGQRKLLDAVLQPEVRLQRADIQQLSEGKEEQQQDWSPSRDQEEPPEPPHIKNEQEDVWTNQKEDQLQVLQGEDDVIKWIFTPVKCEEVGERPCCGQTEEMQTEAHGEDCGGPEPPKNLQTASETRSSAIPPASKQLGCSVCCKGPQKNSLTTQRLNSEGNRFSCSVCKKTFKRRVSVMIHMRIHTGEKPFGCSICGARFSQKAHLSEHLRIHTGEKPFGCLVCGKGFTQRSNLTKHLRVHTGEKPFSCPVCQSSFSDKATLSRHKRVHTGEKPFSCSVCGKAFAESGGLRRHVRIHTGEKPFSCRFCDRRFSQTTQMKKHKCIGESSRVCDITQAAGTAAEPSSSSSEASSLKTPTGK